MFEDGGVVVLAKPPGISVTGERHDTDLVTMAQAAGERLLPAHRIDKVTSGIVVFAKTDEAHASLARQFNKRTVDKRYLAILRSRGLPETGTIDLPLSLGRKNKVRIASLRSEIVFDEEAHRWSVARTASFHAKRVYPSISTFARVIESARRTALVVRPISGRRHQIRTHLAWIGHPIEGDPLYMKDPATAARTYLHSWTLGFDVTWAGEPRRLVVEATPDDEFWRPFRRELPTKGPGVLVRQARAAAQRLPNRNLP